MNNAENAGIAWRYPNRDVGHHGGHQYITRPLASMKATALPRCCYGSDMQFGGIKPGAIASLQNRPLVGGYSEQFSSCGDEGQQQSRVIAGCARSEGPIDKLITDELFHFDLEIDRSVCTSEQRKQATISELPRADSPLGLLMRQSAPAQEYAAV
jgi:hypothetical protein